MSQLYAIVDIETTGSHASANGITEIAICIHDGQDVIHRYETLINPHREIPEFIQALTGIDNDMVRNAPSFDDVAAEIFDLLSGKIFVAHNVNFDYSFVRYHLASAGFDLQCNKLCTVRLGRKILPGMRSYSLGKLCHQLGITNQGRHRAGGDAAATAQLFTMLLQNDRNNHISDSLKQRSKEQTLPANLPKADIDKLPLVPGVYYFHDQKGKVIYVGKAINIKKRVCSHFTGNNPNLQRQEFLKHIHQVTFQECGTELMALTLEAIEIKRLWPGYNRSLKRFEQAYGLFTFLDQRGYLRLAVDKRRKYSDAVYTCNSPLDGYNLLQKLIDNYELCPKFCFVQKNNLICAGSKGEQCACHGQESVDDYNLKVEAALEGLKLELPTFAIRDKGRTYEEYSCLLIEGGRFYGMGFIPHDYEADHISELKSYLTPYPHNDYIRNMAVNFVNQYPEKRVMFTGELID